MCGNCWALLLWPSDQLARRRGHHFPVTATSGWVSSIAVLAVLAVGADHVALSQIPTISASPASTHAGLAALRRPRPDLYRSPVRSRRSFDDTRACQMRTPVVVLNVPFSPRHRAFSRAGLTGIGRRREPGDGDLEIWVALSPVGDRLTDTGVRGGPSPQQST